ncbi:MAG: hypothetical protein LC800_22230 [Acidobacteria bacterium]|nr:hypothetical protein [Acidobacteriota bacterium]
MSVAEPVNSPPSVSITSPRASAEFVEGANISISAAAADGDGTIARVDFYVGTQFIGATATSPYVVLWNQVPAGNYTLTAIATDNSGARTTSAPVSIRVLRSRTGKSTGSKGGGKKTSGALTQSTSSTSPDLSPGVSTIPVVSANPPGGASASTRGRRRTKMSRLIQ